MEDQSYQIGIFIDVYLAALYIDEQPRALVSADKRRGCL